MADSIRRSRMERLVQLCLLHRGWSRRRLARELGRDPVRLTPASGLPKLDVLIGLATTLEWPVDLVAEFLWMERLPVGPSEFVASEQARSHGTEAPAESSVEYLAADLAANLADSLAEGRFADAIPALERALREPGRSDDERNDQLLMLAEARLHTGALHTARALALELCPAAAPADTENHVENHRFACALSIVGHAARQLMTVDPGRRREHGAEACRAFGAALDRAISPESARLACCSGQLEVASHLGETNPRRALATLAHGVSAPDHENCSADHRIGLAWWALSGCRIALHDLTREDDVSREMAFFTEHAHRLLDGISCWPIHERLFTLEHTRWFQTDTTGIPIDPPALDREELRIILGTMARFPTFRPIGRHLLCGAVEEC